MEQLFTATGREDKVYVFNRMNLSMLSEIIIARHYTSPGFENLGTEPLVADELNLNHGVFTSRVPAFPVVVLMQQADALMVTCNCEESAGKLCRHGAEVLLQVMKREEWRIFFDEKLRQGKLKKFATSYGLENEPDLDSFFQLNYQGQKLSITPRSASLFPATKESLSEVAQLLLPADANLTNRGNPLNDRERCIVIKQHKYYKHLVIELYHAPRTKDGRVKNPLTLVIPLELAWESNDPLELKFFAAVSRFQQTINAEVSASVITSLKAVVKNPLGLDIYIHDSTASESISANALQQVKIKTLQNNIELTVTRQGQFYELLGKLKIGEQQLNLGEAAMVFTYFIRINDTLYLVKDMAMLGAINLFKRKPEGLLIHQSQYADFKFQVLNKLEETGVVRYPGVKPASKAQLKEQGFDRVVEKIIYLSDFGQHVMLVPVMRYGEIEISILTKKQIYTEDSKGNAFAVRRDETVELAFTALLIKQHPYFEEQLPDDQYYFYLHKKHFLNEDWFLNAFDEWQNQRITILGFNEINGNNLNLHKVKVTIQVQSGINWFNTKVKARFGKQKVNMKSLYKAIRNKNKFVQLDDGTMGILPAEWIAKFTDYFTAAEVLDDDTLRTPKINYASIEELYEEEMLDDVVRLEIKNYRQKLQNFEAIQDVPVPAGLNTTLRTYQQEGLNWLNFLDDFNFGGCLADDMGLGKTIQIIAFVLSQRDKIAHNTNLLVVPTSLIFNWQAELLKFAPSLKVHTIYGPNRIRSIANFDQYEIVLTSYGTLLSDVNFLKEYVFNYLFLDESQNIKNPGSQRYKAARLLKSRNKIVITGTPIENNTFDLYGQLSFACPGLLGSRQYFKDIYSSPIDKFKVSKRFTELQKKVQPFILRRTKQQVAHELPDKTEMVLYCEMQPEQRKIYDAYEKEFREFISATTEEQLPRSSMHVLKGITKLRQICDSPLLLEGEKVPGNASAKMDTLLEQIESKAPYHKILIFSQFVGMLNLIRKELETRKIRFSYLTGSTRNREAVVNDFQDNDGIRVFLISLKAGGIGLNLTAADYVYLIDPWWNPAIENQAIDRSYRIGQHKNVIAVRLICQNTIEEKMVKIQESKRNLADNLVQADADVFKSLTKADLLTLFGRT
ncbi:MAG: helicase [Mucilaginibacter sp.]|nr:helicase [Mucilaginibacter sp.]